MIFLYFTIISLAFQGFRRNFPAKAFKRLEIFLRIWYNSIDMKFVELAKKLKEGLDPVYLVEGEDAYFREHAVGMIRSKCSLSMPALNDIRVDGDTLKGEKLSSFVADLNALPFLDEKRLVRAAEFYPTEREWGMLEPYVKSPCPSTVLVIVNGGKKKGVELKKKNGITYIDCSKESEETLSKWIFSLLRAKNVRIGGDAALLLARYCGQDAARMYREAEKLVLLLDKGEEITAELIEENVPKDTEYKLYELTQAASKRNFSAFSEILHDLMEKGFDEYAALSALASHYRVLVEVTSLKGSDAEVSAILGIKPYAVQKNREAARRLGQRRAEELFQTVYALAADARSGGMSKTGALDAAIAEIFFG